MMKVAYAVCVCVLAAVSAHEACPGSDPTCSAAEEAALLQHAANRHVNIVTPLKDVPMKVGKCDSDCTDYIIKLESSWKLNSDEPFLLSSHQPIFKYSPDDIDKSEWHKFETLTTEGSTQDGCTKTMSASFGVKAKYGAFEGSAQAAIKSATSSSTASFYKADHQSFTDFEMVSQPLDPAENLTPEAMKLLKELPVDDIYERFGDFYATKISFGGTLSTTMITSMSQSDTAQSVSASVKASYQVAMAGGTVKASFNGAQQFASAARSITIKTDVTGGDEKLWVDLADDGSNFDDLRDKWGKSINGTNMIPVKFDLHPMWHLFDTINSSKGEELKEYMTKQWNESISDLPFGKEWKELGLGECAMAEGGRITSYKNLTSLEDCKTACLKESEEMCKYMLHTEVLPPKMSPELQCILVNKAADCEASPLGATPNLPGLTTYVRP